ncbi:MAG TPA: lytic transglycosylase domain-containing protein [Chitinophagaceae bacterium]|nr:lytic transglycosylase domain-containing protein [Chitinophagaceae bacterium]
MRFLYFSLLLSFFFSPAAITQIADNEEIIEPIVDTVEFNIPDIRIKEILNFPNYIEFPDLLKGHENEALSYVESFAKRRKDYLIRTYNKDLVFSQKILPIFNQFNVPSELRVLMALESAYNANARSRAGAVGYWQFMDRVAKEYGLKVPQVKFSKQKTKKGKTRVVKKVIGKKDDRKDFFKSTYAAARYLHDRRRDLNDDWLLIVASYNYGVGNVWNAMTRCKKENPTFWDIKDLLPAETRSYVMNFIALNVIFHNYEKFINDELIYSVLPVYNTSYEIEKKSF